jgi:hypothetical protein
MVNFALIGLGKQGQKYIRALNEVENAELTMVHSRTEDSYNSLNVRPKYHHIWTKTADDIFNASEVECVIIASPPDTHFGLCKKALMAGKDIICEKPFCMNDEESRIIQEMVEERNLCCIIDFTHLWQPELQEILASNREVNSIISIVRGAGVDRASYSRFRDWFAHDLSIIFSIRKEEKLQDISYRGDSTDITCANNFLLTLDFDSGSDLIFIETDVTPERKKRLLLAEYKDGSFGRFADDFNGKPLNKMLEGYITINEKGIIATNIDLACRVNDTLDWFEENYLREATGN